MTPQASDLTALLRLMFNRRVRVWIYGLALASVPVLVYKDVIEPEAAALAGPFLLALLNVPRQPDADE